MTDEEAVKRQPPRASLLYQNGWYVLPSRGGLVTYELIDKIQEELDREDARIAAGLPPGGDGQ